MPEDKSVSLSLVNLGKVSEPAVTLIKKVSSAIGGIFEPWQIRRVAKASAEADLVKARSEIEITDLHRRAMHRFVEEEASRQENMERITRQAFPQLNESSDPSKMEDDWVTHFFDKARIVSDEQMQDLWSSVLAGEANAPGTYSKRTVSFLGDLDKRDAEFFRILCNFSWVIDTFTPVVFDYRDSIYREGGLTFDALTHLDSIGLIRFEHAAPFTRTDFPKRFDVSYCGKRIVLTTEHDGDNWLPIGSVLFSQVGSELATVCNETEVDGFFDYVKEKWKQYHAEPITAEQEAAAEPDIPRD